ncbi:MAG: nitrate/nitrite transporter NrtS [Aliivibrio sp.]|uniref:nitrate/nitrite transporter NrtS n=1 Tax=Aliivibrio sp. TaxID=1872443 RepID=UPI001A5DFCF0|nr:nitrate/nitrite transporter NrtS [Aliivibrio sp.]
MQNIKIWLSVATSNNVIARSTKIALIVGTILMFINQLDVLMAGEISLIILVKILLTYCVPYCVSTYSSVEAILSTNIKN